VCQKAAPIVNRLFHVIQEDSSLRDDIKMLGIACGNDQKEISVYRKNFRVAFPLFSDKKYEIYNAIGNPGTPFMILVTVDGKVLMTHRGLVQDLDQLLKEVREAHKHE
jgi:hypothetical protein